MLCCYIDELHFKVIYVRNTDASRRAFNMVFTFKNYQQFENYNSYTA